MSKHWMMLKNNNENIRVCCAGLERTLVVIFILIFILQLNKSIDPRHALCGEKVKY